MKRFSIATTCATLLLAGCDGSNPRPDGPTPTPSPTVTSAPTPTPTPTPTPIAVPPFPVETRETFALTTYLLHRSGASSSFEIPAPPFDLVTNGTRELSLDVQTGRSDAARWLLAGYYFYPARAATEGDREFNAPTPEPVNTTATFLNTIFADGVPSEPEYRFNYVSYVRQYRTATRLALPPWYYDYYIFGYPTAATAIPATGPRSYNAVTRADILSIWRYGLINQGTGSETIFTVQNAAANFTARTFTFTMVATFKRLPAGASPTMGPAATATFNATGAIDSSGKIAGTIASADGGYTGRFAGIFHGPSAQEVGLVFGIDANLVTDGKPSHQRLIGVMLGK